MALKLLLAFILCILSIGCTQTIQVIGTTNSTPEEDFCEPTNTVYAGGYTVSGHAYYKKRTITVAGLGAPGGNNPIRGAEVQVLSAGGSRIQCGETDATGAYSVDIPNTGATYTVKINSRSGNSDSLASVLKNPVANTYYSLTTTIVANANHPGTDFTAEADEALDSDVKGGAFNILDQIYAANIFLEAQLGASYTANSKVQAYWTAGYSQAPYVGGSATDDVSFYVPGTNKLYILGGIQGDIDSSDTDHFDDSVILHEFGHFLEDNYSVSDSPGGSHSGTRIIDPRLAWSEGFASFISSYIRSNSIYKDTYGHSGGVTGFGYYYDMDLNEDDSGNTVDNINATSVSYTSNLGEGIFREWAVSRLLWDATDNSADDEDVNLDGQITGADAAGTDIDTVTTMPLSELWTIYTGNFASNKAFREMGHFLFYQDGGATDISTLLTADKDSYYTVAARMVASRLHYGTEDNNATTDDTGVAACQWIMRARDQSGFAENGSFSRSNPFYSNDFYYIDHPGGVLTIDLVYTRTGSKGNLDLILYKNNYTYGDTADMVSTATASGDTDGGTESISRNVTAGKYMLNVRYNTAEFSTDPLPRSYDSTTYDLTINGNVICR